MSFQDFFRSFIGLNPRYYDRREDEHPVNRFRNPPWGDDPDEDDDFDELYTDYRNGLPGRGGEFGFNIFTGDVLEMHKFFERQMNEVMKGFTSLGPSFDFSSSQEMPERGMLESLPKEGSSEARDRYLKPGKAEPRFGPSNGPQTDSDIDDRVSSEGLGSLFKKGRTDEPSALVPRGSVTVIPPQRSHSSFQRSYSSRVTVDLGNGRREERVKEWSSDGVEKERVSRTLGDQTHSLTTSRTGERVTTEEQLLNIDQDALGEFDSKWSSGMTRQPPQVDGGTPPSGDTPRGGILSPLFRLFS